MYNIEKIPSLKLERRIVKETENLQLGVKAPAPHSFCVVNPEHMELSSCPVRGIGQPMLLDPAYKRFTVYTVEHTKRIWVNKETKEERGLTIQTGYYLRLMWSVLDVTTLPPQIDFATTEGGD